MKPLISFFRKIFKLDNWVLFTLKLESIFPKLIPLLSNQYGSSPDRFTSGFLLFLNWIFPLRSILLTLWFNGILRFKSEIKFPYFIAKLLVIKLFWSQTKFKESEFISSRKPEVFNFILFKEKPPLQIVWFEILSNLKFDLNFPLLNKNCLFPILYSDESSLSPFEKTSNFKKSLFSFLLNLNINLPLSSKFDFIFPINCLSADLYIRSPLILVSTPISLNLKVE